MDSDKVLETIKDCSCFIDEANDFVIAPSHCLTVLKNILLGLNNNIEFNMAFLSGEYTVCLIVDKKIRNTTYRFGVEIWEHKIDLCVFKMQINDMVLVDSFECDNSQEVLDVLNAY